MCKITFTASSQKHFEYINIFLCFSSDFDPYGYQMDSEAI